MSRRQANIFAECLEAIDRGEMTPAECLARHPELGDELAELFAGMEAIQSVTVEPRPEFRRNARERLLARLPDQADQQC